MQRRRYSPCRELCSVQQVCVLEALKSVCLLSVCVCEFLLLSERNVLSERARARVCVCLSGRRILQL